MSPGYFRTVMRLPSAFRRPSDRRLRRLLSKRAKTFYALLCVTLAATNAHAQLTVTAVKVKGPNAIAVGGTAKYSMTFRGGGAAARGSELRYEVFDEDDDTLINETAFNVTGAGAAGLFKNTQTVSLFCDGDDEVAGANGSSDDNPAVVKVLTENSFGTDLHTTMGKTISCVATNNQQALLDVGDATSDLVVDIADLNKVRNHFGSPYAIFDTGFDTAIAGLGDGITVFVEGEFVEVDHGDNTEFLDSELIGFGFIGPDELNAVRNNFGLDLAAQLENPPLNGAAGTDNLNAVRNNFGAAMNPVPEPSTLALASLFAFVGGVVRRRRG